MGDHKKQLLAALHEVVGESASKEVDAEIISYVASIIEVGAASRGP